MKNGLMIASNIGGNTAALFVEEEVLEQAHLNRRTRERLRKAEKKEKLTRKRVREHSRRLQKLIVRVGAAVAASAGVAMAEATGLMDPMLGTALMVAAMVYISFLLGRHLGRCGR